MKNCEALFVLRPGQEESIKKVTALITDSIKKNKGKILKEDNWGKRTLAYPIKKHREGIYYKLNFSIGSLLIETLNRTYKLNSGILRTLIIKR